MLKYSIKILILFIIVLCYIYFEVNFPKIKYLTIQSNKIFFKKEISILQISDLHNKNFSNHNKYILSKIKKLKPNIIVLTGDIIDATTQDFKNVYIFLEAIVKINPNTYFVTGNHEWRNKNAKEFLEEVQKRKIMILHNTNTLFYNENITLNVCGIDDPYSNHENIQEAFKHVDTNHFTLLLSHSPNVIMKYENLPCDLILSGHTHGGQVRLPILGSIIAPGQGFFPKYDKGLYKLHSNQLLYIDSGLGTSSLPIRFLNRSQMSFITIKRKDTNKL